jgi:hypothetical protein
MVHVPSIVGAALLFGICYVLVYVTLTGIQIAAAIVALIVVYAATVDLVCPKNSVAKRPGYELLLA